MLIFSSIPRGIYAGYLDGRRVLERGTGPLDKLYVANRIRVRFGTNLRRKCMTLGVIDLDLPIGLHSASMLQLLLQLAWLSQASKHLLLSGQNWRPLACYPTFSGRYNLTHPASGNVPGTVLTDGIWERQPLRSNITWVYMVVSFSWTIYILY